MEQGSPDGLGSLWGERLLGGRHLGLQRWGGGLQHPPREQVRGWGQLFTPSSGDANHGNMLRVQQGTRAGSTHSVLGRAGLWGAAYPHPIGVVTVPWGLRVGMLGGHTPNLLVWGIYSAPTHSPAPGCGVGRRGLERAGMRRVLGGQDAAGYQSTPILGFSPHHSPACAALLGTGCGVSVPQFPHVPGDAAPQALPALCSLAGGVGWVVVGMVVPERPPAIPLPQPLSSHPHRDQWDQNPLGEDLNPS